MASRFEWNKRKAAANLKKHGFSFEEASTVFDDEMFITVVDDEHSNDEGRYITIGMSNTGRLLMVAPTDREDRIRIISVRKATKYEENFYIEAS